MILPMPILRILRILREKQSATIYAISIIVIGGILLIRSFPQLIRQLIVYFQQSSLPVDYSSNPASSFVLLNFIMTLIGIYFITSNRTIVSFIEKQRRKSALKNSGLEE